MLILISPAKTLDFESPCPNWTFTQPEMLDEAQLLVRQLRTLSPAEIGSLMKLSDKLASLNAARYGSWSLPFTPENARPALLAFRGDVYAGLDADTLSEEDREFAQAHLRILSGLYGLLRPLDLIQPYRLEMGTRLANARGKDLYAFWGDLISERLNEELARQGSELVVNLASNEYFRAVNPRRLKARIVTPEFRDLKNGQYKIISFWAKKARGLMSRFIIRNRIINADALKEFDLEGYRFSEEDSQGDRLVFLRDHP